MQSFYTPFFGLFVFLGLLLPAPLQSENTVKDFFGVGPDMHIATAFFGIVSMYTFGEVVMRRIQKLMKNGDPSEADVEEFFEGVAEDFADEVGIVTKDNLEEMVDIIMTHKYTHVANREALKKEVVAIVKEEFEVNNK